EGCAAVRRRAERVPEDPLRCRLRGSVTSFSTDWALRAEGTAGRCVGSHQWVAADEPDQVLSTGARRLYSTKSDPDERTSNAKSAPSTFSEQVGDVQVPGMRSHIRSRRRTGSPSTPSPWRSRRYLQSPRDEQHPFGRREVQQERGARLRCELSCQ